MGKKTFYIFLVLVVAISGFLCYNAFIPRLKTDTYNNESVPNQDVAVNKTKSDGEIVEIPIDSVKGITKQEAEKLCQMVLGEKDEETGFVFSFGTSGAVKTKGEQYYCVRVSWLVDGSHLSYLGDFFVSADGKEIYNGTALAGEYVMEDVIWRE